MKYVVATLAGIGILLAYAFLGVRIGWTHGGGSFPQVILWSAVVASWVAIVKNWPADKTGSGATTGTMPQTTSRPPSIATVHPTAPGVGQAQAIDERASYAQAMAECTDRTAERDAGLWAKAFSLCEGDERRTQAKYIELRVADLTEAVRSTQHRLISAARSKRHEFTCPACDMSMYVTGAELSDIQQSARVNWGRECPYCDAAFDLRTPLHTELILYSCPECGKPLITTKWEADAIQRANHPNWMGLCPGCKCEFDISRQITPASTVPETST
jgi:hypothetical protein